jgi:glycosyltransferase involved in cell wall biosynthesis
VNSRLVIVQPYIPRYRVPFFAGLTRALASNSVECVVAAGVPTGAQKYRGDQVSDLPWAARYEPRRLRIGSRVLDLGGSRSSWAGADAVILGLQGTLADSYSALLRGSRQRVGLWGHVASYVAPSNRLDHALERWQARRSDHVFAYTESGAAEALRMGVDPRKVTTVMNSLDTQSLIASYHRISDADKREFRSANKVEAGRTFCFVGGLDESKRIDLLAEALDILWNEDRSIRVLVGGRGKHEGLLARAIQRQQVVHLGFADDQTIAMMSAVSEALLMPGRIGLVAVQALALGLPILTTEYAYHAPEAEYLVEGTSRRTSAADAASFAALVLSSVGGDQKTRPGSWPYPTLEQMIGNYSVGVMAMLEREP